MTRLTPAARRVLDALRASDKPLTIRALCEATGLTRRAVERAILDLGDALTGYKYTAALPSPRPQEPSEDPRTTCDNPEGQTPCQEGCQGAKTRCCPEAARLTAAIERALLDCWRPGTEAIETVLRQALRGEP